MQARQYLWSGCAVQKLSAFFGWFGVHASDIITVPFVRDANLFFLTMLRQHSQYDRRLGFSFRVLVRVSVRVRVRVRVLG